MEKGETEERVLLKVLERLESIESTVKQPQSMAQWIPVYVALAGLFFGASNIYTGIMTRITLLEQQVQLVKELVIKEKSK
jgi:exonuclease V gamma subunit